MHVGQIIQKAISGEGLTQQHVADHLGISRSAVNQMLQREHVNTEIIYKLSLLTQVDLFRKISDSYTAEKLRNDLEKHISAEAFKKEFGGISKPDSLSLKALFIDPYEPQIPDLEKKIANLEQIIDRLIKINEALVKKLESGPSNT